MILIYISSYIILSRRGFSQADKYNIEGFYFFLPKNTTTWRVMNYSCVYLYYPLIKIDVFLGTGRGIANEPLAELE